MNPRILTTTIAALLFTPALFATTSTWDGGGANNTFSTPANWNLDTAPTSDIANTDLVFAGGLRLTPNLTSAFSAKTVTFDNTAGVFGISGLTLSVGAGGIVNNDTDTMTFNNLVNFFSTTNSTINAASGGLTFTNQVQLPTGTLTVDGIAATSFVSISGVTALTKQGTGTMSWSPAASANAFSLAVAAGTLSTVADGTTDLFSGGGVAVNGTAVFNINENLTIDTVTLSRATGATLSLAAGKTLRLQNGADAVFTGAYTDNTASTILVTGTGSTLSTTSTLTLNGGSTLNVQAGGSVSTGANIVTVGNGGAGTLAVDGTGSSFTGGSLSLATTSSSSLTFSNAATGSLAALLVSGVLAGPTGTVSIQSGATVTTANLVVAQTAAGNTGTVTITGTSSALTVSGAAATTLGATALSTATLNVQSGGTFNGNTGTMTVNATGTIAIAGGTFNANGDLTVNGQLTRDATGTFTLAAGKTLTLQNSGDFSIIGAFSNSTASTITVTGPGSTLTTTSQLMLDGGSTTNVLAGAVFNAGAGTVIIGGAAGSNGTATVDASGTSFAGGSLFLGSSGGTGLLTYTNSSTGTFTTINVDNSGSAGSVGTLGIQSGAFVTGTSLFLGNLAAANSGTVTINGTGSGMRLTGAATATIGAASLSTAALNVQNGGTFTTGTGLMTVNATGTVAIAGGTFNADGDLTVNGLMTRDTTGSFNLSAGRTLTMQNGGDFTLISGISNITASTITVTGAGSTFAPAGTLILGGGSVTNAQLGGSISATSMSIGYAFGNASVTVDGAGSSLTGTSTLFLGGSGATANLTFSNGSTGAFGEMWVDNSNTAGTVATLNIQSGATVTGTLLYFSQNGGANTGTINISGAGSALTLNGATFSNIGTGGGGGTGTINVQSGGTFTSNTAPTNVFATGTINLNGGTANFRGPLVLSGGTLNFNTGELDIIDNFTVGTGGLFGTSLTLDASRKFATTGITTIDAFRTLTLSGGTFSTGVLLNNGTLAFTSGTLAITGAGGFNIGTGALGSSVTLGTGARLQVTNTTTIAGGALLRLNGGGFSGASIANSGTIDHQDGTLDFTGTLTNAAAGRLFVGGLASPAGAITNVGRITLQNGIGLLGGAGAITNTGLITGEGTIAKPVTNSAAGQLRAELGKTLTFTGAVASNAGTFSLQGGTLEFTTAITNSSTGFISGRGSLITAGLTNQGVLAFSGGTADVYGDVTNSAGARIVTSGANSVTTFYDDVVHNGLEIYTGASASTVFFGGQTGAGSFTGTGTVYFNGDLRPGNSPASVSYGGDVALGGASSLTLELGGLLAGTQYDRLNVAGTLFEDGVLDVSLYGGFMPHFGDTFDLFDAGGIAGSFDAVNLPALAGDLAWDATNFQSTGQLRVVPEPGIGTLLLSAFALLGLLRNGCLGRRGLGGTLP